MSTRPTRLPSANRILYGADYNPDQWLNAEAILDEDLRLMQDIGMTSVSIGIFSWTALEPRPGVYTFEWMDALMDRLHENGLKAFLATPSGAKPMWLSETYPEIRRVKPDGRRDPSGGRHNHCPTSPVYRTAVQRINRELALRYGKHPALALWHIGNELNGECHCDLCRRAFQDWLRERYGSLEALNLAWWTSFWNQTFTDWSQIPTQSRCIDALPVDWLRFVNDQHVSFLENEMAPLRELTPEIPCTTNMMGAHPTSNYAQWAGVLDCISNDCYPLYDDRDTNGNKFLSTDFTHSLMRGLAKGDPWILMECSPSSVNWGKINKLKRPGVHELEVLQAVANGADVIHYFQWRKGRGGYEKYHGAVMDHEGSTRSRVYQDCARVGKILQSLQPVAGSKTKRAPAAILYDWESRWALKASAGPKQSRETDLQMRACSEQFRALRQAGADVDVLPVGGDFSRYRMVITPALYLLTPETAGRLTAFVRAGGVWVASCLTGYVDANNRCWRGGFPGPELRKVFGLWNEETDYLHDDERILLNGELFNGLESAVASDIVEHLHAEGAEVLAEYASDFYAGSPAILRHALGEGWTYYVGARLSEDAQRAFYTSLLEDLKIKRDTLPEGVFRKTRTGPDGPVEFLFNYNRTPVTLDTGTETYLRTATGETLSGRFQLKPYDSLVKGLISTPSSLTRQPTESHEHEVLPVLC